MELCLKTLILILCVCVELSFCGSFFNPKWGSGKLNSKGQSQGIQFPGVKGTQGSKGTSFSNSLKPTKHQQLGGQIGNNGDRGDLFSQLEGIHDSVKEVAGQFVTENVELNQDTDDANVNRESEDDSLEEDGFIEPDVENVAVSPTFSTPKPATNVKEEFLKLISNEFLLCHDILRKQEGKMNETRLYISTNFASVINSVHKSLKLKQSKANEQASSLLTDTLSLQANKYQEQLGVIVELVNELRSGASTSFLEFLKVFDLSRRKAVFQYYTFTHSLTLDVTKTKKAICKDLEEIGVEAANEMRQAMNQISKCNQEGLTKLYYTSSKLKEDVRKMLNDINASYKSVKNCLSNVECVKIWKDGLEKLKDAKIRVDKDIAYENVARKIRNLKNITVKCFLNITDAILVMEEKYVEDILNCLELG